MSLIVPVRFEHSNDEPVNKMYFGHFTNPGEKSIPVERLGSQKPKRADKGKGFNFKNLPVRFFWSEVIQVKARDKDPEYVRVNMLSLLGRVGLLNLLHFPRGKGEKVLISDLQGKNYKDLDAIDFYKGYSREYSKEDGESVLARPNQKEALFWIKEAKSLKQAAEVKIEKKVAKKK